MGVPTKVISSSIPFQDGAGNVVANGTLRLQLTQNATVTSGGGQVTTEPIFFILDSTGKIPANSVCWFNDELTPSGTAYHATLIAKNGCRTLVDYGNWVLSGASVDVSTIAASTTTVSYANAVLTNPPSGALQTIAGPLNVKTFENVRYADQFSGADIGAKVNAAFADLSGAYGTIVIPPGTYTQTTDIALTSPCHLAYDPAAVVTYNGTGKMIKVGPDGLTSVTYSPIEYIITGGRFTGGASATHGIYFNKYVVKNFVFNSTFLDFGNASCWNIFYQSQNWECHLTEIYMWSTSTGPTYNGVRVNGYDTDNTTADNGQSNLTMLHCHLQSSTATTGTGVHLNGFKNQILDCNITNFAPNVRFRRWANNCVLDNVYTETSSTAAGVYSFQYGDINSDPSASIGTYISGMTIHDCFCNVHNSSFTTTAHPIGPSTASAGIINTDLKGMVVSDITAGQPVVVMNNSINQVGNRASGTQYNTTNAIPTGSTFGIATLHTSGANITAWDGTDENMTAVGTIAALGSGTAAAPAIQIGTNGTPGFFNSGGHVEFTNGGTSRLGIFNAIFQLTTAHVVGWTSTTINGADDLGISRVSAGVLGVGTGAAGSVNAEVQLKRLKANGGSALVTGDVGSISAGWGNTATCSAVTGRDQAGTISIASAGTGQSGNPTFVLTFHDGTWTTSPIITATRTENGAPSGGIVASTTATAATFTFLGTPVAGTTYTISFICMGV